MRHKVHYVIRPNDRLLRELLYYPRNVWEMFIRPIIWSREEGDRSVASLQEREEQITLLFLLYLATDVLDSEEDNIKRLRNTLLSDEFWTIHTFERWWHCERADYDGSVDSIRDELDARYVERLGSTSDMVSSWLEEIRKRRAGGDS